MLGIDNPLVVWQYDPTLRGNLMSKYTCPACDGTGHRGHNKSTGNILPCPICNNTKAITSKQVTYMKDYVDGFRLHDTGSVNASTRLTPAGWDGYWAAKYAAVVQRSSKFDTDEQGYLPQYKDEAWLKAGFLANQALSDIILFIED